jgi:hypothetical protein
VKSHLIGSPSKPRYHELVHPTPGANVEESAIQSLMRPLPTAHDHRGSCCAPKRHGLPRLSSASVTDPAKTATPVTVAETRRMELLLGMPSLSPIGREAA